MPVLLIAKIHYLVSHKKIRKLALERELEDNQRGYHWKIWGINEENSLITSIYLVDTMKEALAQKQEIEVIAELQSDITGFREYEFYEVMVDQSLITKAPILMSYLGVKSVNELLDSNGENQNVLKI